MSGMGSPPLLIFSRWSRWGERGSALRLFKSKMVHSQSSWRFGLTRGFDMSAGAVVLLSSPSYAAVVGTADYAAEFVQSSGQLRNAFMGGVTVLHGIPFLIGGTNKNAAIRALAEIEHWVSTTSVGTDEISATRKLFMDSLRSSNRSLMCSI
jgi:hypothetical protein